MPFELKIKVGDTEFQAQGEFADVQTMVHFLLEKGFLVEKEPVLSSVDSSVIPENSISELSNQEVLSKKAKTKRGSGTKSTKILPIELPPSFDEPRFVSEFHALNLKGYKDQILVLVYMYKTYTGEKEFTESLVHTLLDKVAIDTPSSLSAMLSNYMNRDKYIEKTDSGFKLKYVGETFCQKKMNSDQKT